MKKVLLLDIENQTQKIGELLKLLNEYDQVILVYANNHLKIALNDLTALSQAIQEQRLLVIKMSKAGENSADFGLTFIAGRLSATLEQNSCVDVMSNDREMSYAVELLSQVGIQSVQLKQSMSIPQNKVVEPLPIVQNDNQTSLLEPKIVKVLEILIKNQPKKYKSLKKSLVSWCKIEKDKAEVMIQYLQSMHYITAKDEKLKYHDDKIKNTLLQSNDRIHVKTEDQMTIAYIAAHPHLMQIKKYCDYLEKIKNNKPSKQSGLENSLKSVLKLEENEKISDMICLLREHKIIEIEGQKIMYQIDNITRWSILK